MSIPSAQGKHSKTSRKQSRTRNLHHRCRAVLFPMLTTSKNKWCARGIPWLVTRYTTLRVPDLPERGPMISTSSGAVSCWVLLKKRAPDWTGGAGGSSSASYTKSHGEMEVSSKLCLLEDDDGLHPQHIHILDGSWWFSPIFFYLQSFGWNDLQISKSGTLAKENIIKHHKTH